MVKRNRFTVRLLSLSLLTWKIIAWMSSSGSLCHTGFTGHRCETDIDECDSQPCYFGGSCTDQLNGYSCVCVDGFIGPRCEAVVRQCPLINPCSQNAVCVEKPTGSLLELWPSYVILPFQAIYALELMLKFLWHKQIGKNAHFPWTYEAR